MGVRAQITARGRGPAGRAAAASIATGFSLQLTIAVSGVVSARVLGVDDRGRLALLWIVTTVSAQVATLGLHAAIAYAIAAGEPAQSVVQRVRRRLLLQLVAAPLLAGAVMVALFDGSHSTTGAGLAMLSAAPAFVLLLYGIAIVQGERRYRAVQFNRLLQPLLFAALLIGLAIAGGGDLVLISALWAATMVFAALLAWRQALGAWRPGAAAGAPSGRPLGELQRFGRRSFFGAFGTTEHLMLDQLLLGVLLSPRDFGLYVAANAFSNLPRFVGQSIGYVAYPEVAAAGEGRMRVLRRFSALGAAVTAPLVLGLVASIGWLLPLLFGDAFSDAVPVARVLLVGAFLQSLRRVLSESSRGLGGGLPGTLGELAFVIVLLGTAIPLADASGASGGALAVAVAALAGYVALVAALRLMPPVDVRRRPGAHPGAGSEIAYPEPSL